LDIPDKGVDLDGINVIELLQCLLDLSLVGLDIDDENESVVLLNLLHGALGVERVDYDFVLIKTRLVRNRLAWVLWRARELKGLGLVECGGEADLADLVGVNLYLLDMLISCKRLRTYALQGSLGSSAGLLAGLALGGSTCNHLRISNRS
jgi:hypothetical protein